MQYQNPFEGFINVLMGYPEMRRQKQRDARDAIAFAEDSAMKKVQQRALEQGISNDVRRLDLEEKGGTREDRKIGLDEEFGRARLRQTDRQLGMDEQRLKADLAHSAALVEELRQKIQNNPRNEQLQQQLQAAQIELITAERALTAARTEATSIIEMDRQFKMQMYPKIYEAVLERLKKENLGIENSTNPDELAAFEERVEKEAEAQFNAISRAIMGNDPYAGGMGRNIKVRSGLPGTPTLDPYK